MPWYKITSRLSQVSFGYLKSFTAFLDAVNSGFWLGLMSQKSLDYSDELHYSRCECYTDDKYNEAGLFEWEKQIIDKHFKKVKSILLIAAGGGREALALKRMGFDVDSYECNPVLVEYGNKFLKNNNLEDKISYLPRNTVPPEVKKYDGIILGWGAYSHIPGIQKRLSFLAGLYPFLNNGGPLMITFIWVKKRNRRDKFIKNLSGFLKFGRSKRKIEMGDKLAPNFIHYFTKEEITGELAQSGYQVVEYYDSENACVIATV